MTQPQDGNQPRESDYSRTTVRDRQGMRTGYTTGSCAAAAAKAAVTTLLTGEPAEEVTIHLPVGQDVAFRIHRCEWIDDQRVLCSVIKDGGDDPDATHGAEICVTVNRAPGQSGLKITGGTGVGTVTRPGTGIEVGEPAVTRVPRRMMAESVSAAAQDAGLDAEAGFVAQVALSPAARRLPSRPPTPAWASWEEFPSWAAPESSNPFPPPPGGPAFTSRWTWQPPTAWTTSFCPPEPAARSTPGTTWTCRTWPILRQAFSAVRQ